MSGPIMTLGECVAAEEPPHSPKGASSAERWMNCPGSGVILKTLDLPVTDEPDYRKDGIAAHEAAAYCLTNQVDTWEVMGMSFHDTLVDQEIADAVQTYLDYVRQFVTPSATVFIEKMVGDDPALRPHPQFYGTADFVAYDTDVLTVADYKHGMGVVVEADDNVQMMYYAYGVLQGRRARGHNVRSDRIVRLTIVQPRAFHMDGPIREWETTAGEILEWGDNVLIPAMDRADIDTTLTPGKWCRFCPAKLFCPALDVIFRGLLTVNASEIQSFGQQRMGQLYDLVEANGMIVKAIKDEVFRRNSIGNTVPGTKLVLKKANRVFAEVTTDPNDAEKTIPVVELLEAKLGKAIYSKPELKSPAQVAELGPIAKKLVASVAYMPQTGLTVALASDPKPAVKVEKVQDTFAHLIGPETPVTPGTNGDTND